MCLIFPITRGFIDKQMYLHVNRTMWMWNSITDHISQCPKGSAVVLIKHYRCKPPSFTICLHVYTCSVAAYSIRTTGTGSVDTTEIHPRLWPSQCLRLQLYKLYDWHFFTPKDIVLWKYIKPFRHYCCVLTRTQHGLHCAGTNKATAARHFCFG